MSFPSISSRLEFSLSISKTVLILGRGEVWKETILETSPSVDKKQDIVRVGFPPQHKDRGGRAVTPMVLSACPGHSQGHRQVQVRRGFLQPGAARPSLGISQRGAVHAHGAGCV